MTRARHAVRARREAAGVEPHGAFDESHRCAVAGRQDDRVERRDVTIREARAVRDQLDHLSFQADRPGPHRVRQMSADQGNTGTLLDRRPRQRPWTSQRSQPAGRAREPPPYGHRKWSQREAEVLCGNARHREGHHGHSAPHRDRDEDPRVGQLGRDVGRGVAGPDHEDALAGKRPGPLVVSAVQDLPAEALAPRQLRKMRPRHDAGRHHGRARRSQRPVRGARPPESLAPPEPHDLRFGAHGKGEVTRVRAQVLEHVQPAWKARRAGRKIEPRKRREPPLGVQHEAVVELRPGMSHRAPSLEHNVRDASPRELSRRGQPRGTAADDDRVVVRMGRRLRVS